MSVPPPPPQVPDGFFGGRVPPPPPAASTFGYPTFPGAPLNGPAATFAGPTAATSVRGRVPEPVTVACTMLGVFAAVGVYTLVVVLALAHGGTGGSGDGGASDSTVSFTGVSLGLLYGVLWGGSGVINAVAVVYLRRGNPMARIVTSAICGLWAAYWLRYLVKLGSLGGSDVFFVGTLVHLGELLLLGLATASALPAVLLWRGSAKAHFD